MVLDSFYDSAIIDAEKYLGNYEDDDVITYTGNEKRYKKEDALTLKRIARKLIELNSNGKTLSRYEYFMMGGLPFEEALSKMYLMHADRLFHPLENTTLKRYLSVQVNINSSKKYDFIIKTHYQFGDYVISTEEKEAIWNNLIANGIARKNIDDLVFSGAVRAYALEKGLIHKKDDKEKKLVKRK